MSSKDTGKVSTAFTCCGKSDFAVSSIKWHEDGKVVLDVECNICFSCYVFLVSVEQVILLFCDRDLVPPTKCPNCGGTKFRRDDTPYGRVRRCTECNLMVPI